MYSLKQSLTYQPVELSFGTSGLRGLVTDMTDLECYINTIGFLRYLWQEEGLRDGDKVVVAGDLRDSTPRILGAVTKAVTDFGGQVDYAGLIPTPAAALYAQNQQTPCIMITGSHIPADRNGIKFYKRAGEVLKDDEAPIKKAVAEARKTIYEGDADLFDETGMVKVPVELPPENTVAKSEYLDRHRFDGQPLAGKHIVVYQHSAVGRDMLVETLQSLGAKVTPEGRSDTFVPIDTENITPENKAYFQSLAKKYPDNFAIVSMDGDSDRPFVIDEHGEFYRGDVVGCLVVKELQADFAATPISSNDAIDVFLEESGITSVHTKIGSPYVITAMNESEASVKVGWEVNGGFLLGTAVDYMGQRISELPTRDAFLPILVVLLSCAASGQKLSEYFTQLPPRYTGGGLIDVSQAAADAFRMSATDQAKVEKLVQAEIKDDSLGAYTDVDITDGIRIRFDTNDVIHIRPSGNAPQLRIYTNSDSQARADELATSAIAKGGVLERFIGAVE